MKPVMLVFGSTALFLALTIMPQASSAKSTSLVDCAKFPTVKGYLYKAYMRDGTRYEKQLATATARTRGRSCVLAYQQYSKAHCSRPDDAEARKRLSSIEVQCKDVFGPAPKPRAKPPKAPKKPLRSAVPTGQHPVKVAVTASARRFPDQGLTSKTHAKHVGKTVFSKGPIPFRKEKGVTLGKSFRVMDPIYGRVYLHRSLANSTVQLNTRSVVGAAGYYLRVFIDGKPFSKKAFFEGGVGQSEAYACVVTPWPEG